MTEQDKATLVPSVLNDLIDVDGEPAEGDTLRRVGDVWVPSVGQGINDNGPLVFSLSQTRTGLLIGDVGTTYGFSTAAADVSQANYGDYWGAGIDPVPDIPFARKAADPTQGTEGRYGVEILVPGVYDVAGVMDATLNAAPTVPASILNRVALPSYYPAVRSEIPIVGAGPGSQVVATAVQVTQADIDNGVNFFSMTARYLPQSGTTFVSAYYFQLDVWQRWPGSPTPTMPTS